MTLEQKRAAQAHRDVQAIAGEHAPQSQGRQQYGTLAQKLPILIRSAGLCQALHFLKSRQEGQAVAGTLLGHLAGQLRRADPAIRDGASLCEQVRAANLTVYLWMTREALAVAEWYARLSQSELAVARGEGESS